MAADPHEILNSDVPGGMPMMEGMSEHLNQVLYDAGLGAFDMEPTRLMVPDRTLALNTMSRYAGSASELTFKKNKKNTELASFYQGRYDRGYYYTGPDTVRRNFQIDAVSQGRIDAASGTALGSSTNGEPWDATYYWIASDNTTMPLATAQSMRDFGQATKNYVMRLVQINRTKKNEIAALTTATDVDAYDVTAGWPPNAP